MLRLSRILAACFAAALAILPGIVMAQNKIPPAVIAVVDAQRINRDAQALKVARNQLEQFRFTFQSEIVKEEEKLRAEDQELARQRAVLTPEVFEQRRQAFQNKVIELQRRIQERSQSLDKMLGGVRDQVTQEVVNIMKQLSAERGFNMVLDRAQLQMLSAPESFDITAEVLKRLDQRLPSVKVALPGSQ
jgi:outer membrane protein